MADLEHWDVAGCQSTGFPSWMSYGNGDTPENRAAYINDHLEELAKWLRLGYPDILDEFIEFSGSVCESYRSWLN